MNDAVLRTGLLDLFNVLGHNACGVLLGGGYGLYLKQLHSAGSRRATLIQAELWPAPRATQDLDLMLSAELVANPASMATVRAALDELGYEVVKGAEYMQFIRAASGRQAVKIDLLTAQLDTLQDTPAIEADDRRARPAAVNRPQLHAHPTDGALMLTESPLVIEVSGRLSSGDTSAAQVAIPHPFTYILMKLTAYRDRRNDRDKDLGRHHALDVFRIAAMLSEHESDQVRGRLQQFAENPQVRSCTELVRSEFASANTAGVLAMRQHPLWRNDAQLEVFLDAMKELFS